MRTFLLFPLVLAATLASGRANAVEEKYHEAVKAETAAEFAEVVAAVRAEMAPGGRYRFVQPAERATIDRGLEAMQKLFDDNMGQVAAMSQEEKIALFNAQESVNAILTRRDGDRVICEQRKPVGSNIPKTSCHTYAQEEEARRGTTKVMRDWTTRGCVGGTAGRPCMPGKGGGAR